MRAKIIGLGIFGLLVTPILVSACGGDSDGGVGTTSPTIDQVPALYAASACKSLETCLSNGVMSIFLGGESCTDRTSAQLNDSLPALKQGIEKGTVVFHGDKVNACLAAIEARGCNLSGEPSECTAALDGTVELGSECSLDAECKGGDTYCKTSASCPGKCAPREAAGGACKQDSDCAGSLSCDKNANKCYAPATLGAACGGGGTAPDCTLGTFCIGSDDDAKKTGTCKTLAESFVGKDGEPCFFSDKPLCTADLRCLVMGVNTTTGTLDTKCGPAYPSGAACQVAIPDACPTDEYCKVPQPDVFAGTCTPRPKAGEACAKLFGDDLCAPNTRCDAGTCRPLQAIGGQCSADAVCYSENCSKGSCAAPGGC